MCEPKISEKRTKILLNGKTITKKIKIARIKYWGHIQRRGSDHLLQLALKFKNVGKKKIGRPCFTWRDSLKKDMESYTFTKRDWHAIAENKELLKIVTEELYLRDEESDSE